MATYKTSNRVPCYGCISQWTRQAVSGGHITGLSLNNDDGVTATRDRFPKQRPGSSVANNGTKENAPRTPRSALHIWTDASYSISTADMSTGGEPAVRMSFSDSIGMI